MQKLLDMFLQQRSLLEKKATSLMTLASSADGRSKHNFHKHDKAYINGHALVNPLQFREALNRQGTFCLKT